MEFLFFYIQTISGLSSSTLIWVLLCVQESLEGQKHVSAFVYANSQDILLVSSALPSSHSTSGNERSCSSFTRSIFSNMVFQCVYFMSAVCPISSVWGGCRFESRGTWPWGNEQYVAIGSLLHVHEHVCGPVESMSVFIRAFVCFCVHSHKHRSRVQLAFSERAAGRCSYFTLNIP